MVSLSAIAVLAVAIGLGTVVFAVVDGLLFKPLPYQNPDELSVLRAEAGAFPRQDLSPLAWQEIEGWTSAIPELRLDRGRCARHRLPVGRGRLQDGDR